jgi:two-component system phosphate regulon response regulator OmpR
MNKHALARLDRRYALAMESRPHHLFLVEDDPALREMLTDYLERQGLATTSMSNAEELMRRVNRLRPDLIILDVGLPGMSGLDACRALRAAGDRVPIILLTARAEEVDRIIGLEMGADDYLGKPFSSRELLARIRAVLRRVDSGPGLPRGSATPVRIGDFTFAPASRSLHRGEEVRMLSSLEHGLLLELTCNPRVPIPRERLLAATHGRADAVLLRTIDVAVMRLRKLLEPNPAVPRYIQTVRNLGYMFVPFSGPDA